MLVIIPIFYEYDVGVNRDYGDYMSKTVVVDEDVHALIIDKQAEIREKYNINLKISYMVGSILKRCIHEMEDLLKKEIGGNSKVSDDFVEKNR